MKRNTIKTIGIIILILSLFFLDPIPGPTDFVALQAYSMYSGADVGLDNLSVIYADYFIWSMVVGIILLLLGLHLLGWNFKRLLKFLNLGKYNLCIGLSFLVVILMSFFELYSYLYLLILPIIYYFSEKDFSEALALGFSSYILILFGFRELLSFIFTKTSLPEFVEMQSPAVSWISSTLGFEAITSISLIFGVAISFLIIFLMTKLLREKF